MANAAQHAWMEKVLGLKPAAAAAPAIDAQAERDELAALGLDVADLWQSALEAFETATRRVDAQIGQLQLALRATDDADLHAIADAGLNALTDGTRVPLLAAIRDAGPDGSKLATAAPRVLRAVAAFRARLASAPVRACDANPFGVPVAIARTYDGALERLDYAARIAA